MPFPDRLTDVITSNYQAGSGEIVRASGTLSISLPIGAQRDEMVAILQVGSGTVTVVGLIDGVENATISTTGVGVTFACTGGGVWVTVGLAGGAARVATAISDVFAPIGQQPTVNNIRSPLDTAATIVSTFGAGHGFTTSGADAASNVNDTATGSPLGPQCATVVSAGNGASTILQKTGLTAIDTTSKAVAVLVKVDDVTHLTSLNVSFGVGGFTNEYHIPFNNQVTAGQWVWVTLCIADASTLGSPTRTGITAVRVYHKDDNTGAKVTVHWGGIAFIPNGAAIYPSGVACVSFDDARSTVASVALPYMASKGVRGTVHVITEYLGQAGRLTVAQIKAMQDQAGWCIGGHSHTIADHVALFTTLTAAQIQTNCAAQKEWLRAHGLTGQATAYPSGAVNQTAVESVRQVWRSARNTVGLIETYPCGDPFRLKAFSAISSYSGGRAPSTITATTTGKIDQAVAEKAWLNLVFHQIVPQILSLTMSGNTATITFAAPHEFSVGDTVTMAGWTPAGLNGAFPVTGKTATTISVNIGSNPGDATVVGSALTANTQISYGDFTSIIDKLVSSGIAIRTVDEVFARMSDY